MTTTALRGSSYHGSSPRRSWLDRTFKITERGSNVRTEVRAGSTTFLTMAYIVVLNPLILTAAADVNGEHLELHQVASSTALVAAVMTIFMGVFANFPLALAAGLGINGVVAFQLAGQMSWADAMGVVVLEGLIITFLVLTGFRERIFNAVPTESKHAIGVGIGLFIAFIGFVDAGFIRRNPDAAGTPVPVGIGIGNRLVGWPTVVFCFGLLLMSVLLVRKVRGAIFYGIVGTTVGAMLLNAIVDVPAQFGASGVNPRGWGLNVPSWPHKVFDAPDFGLLGHFSLGGSFTKVGIVSACLAIFTLMLADFFDTMGTVTSVAEEGGLLDKLGRVPLLGRILFVDSIAAVLGGFSSSSSATSYIESATGVGDGARTGLASVVTGLLFVVALFFTPLVAIVPYEAATPALVVVGFLLMTQVKNISWDNWEIALPAFLTIVLMPFTYSITNGIGAGFVTYALLRLGRGKARETGWLLYLIAVAFIVYFAIDPVEHMLGVQ